MIRLRVGEEVLVCTLIFFGEHLELFIYQLFSMRLIDTLYIPFNVWFIRYPIEDELLEPPQSQQIAKLLQVSPDFCSVPGFSNCCIPDILIAWDFLCTFSRSLSLDAIGLDDFVAALNYTVHKDCSNDSDEKKSFDKPSDVPLYLAEVRK